MALLFERVKAPDGVSDVQVVQIDGVEHFAVSFGSMIRVFSSEFKLIGGFLTPFNVVKILPYQDHYFLIGRDEYHAYKGIQKVLEHPFPRGFKKINKILAIRNFLVILHDGRYSLAKIQEMQIRQEDVLTDSTFFTPLSAEKINDFIYILARTYSKKYLITYTVENNLFKCQRREMPNGSFMFKHFGQLIFLDEKGMWLMSEKLSYIRTFGNYKISCVLSTDEKSLLFCRNGEVLSLDNDHRYEVLGLLDCSIDVVSRLGSLYFCGSQRYSYLLEISNREIRIIERYACVGKNEVISRKENIEMVCNKDFVTMRYAISINQPTPQFLDSSNAENHAQFGTHEFVRVDASLNSDLASTKRLKTNALCNPFEKEIQTLQSLPVFPRCFFKGCSTTILNFEDFSIVNGVSFEPINHYSSFGGRDIFSTSNFIFEIGCLKKDLTVYKIGSSIVRYFGNTALILGKNVVSILDTTVRSLKSHSVSFELCDFCISGDFVYCIDFDEHTHKLPMEDFCDCHLECMSDVCLSQFAVELDGTIQTVNGNEVATNRNGLIRSILSEIKSSHDLFTMSNLEEYKCANSSISKASLSMLNANGKLFCTSDDGLDLVADIGSFISCFVNFGNTLVILADKTYAMDLESKKISVVDIKATDSFIYRDQLYLCGDNNLVPFEPRNPTFVYRKTHCNISNSESLICKADNSYVCSYSSVDQKTMNYRLNDSTLSFPSHIESCRCIIRNGLICVALINVSTKASKLVFIAIKGKKLRVRREVAQGLVPLSICSLGNTIVSICPDRIVVLRIKNNRIRILKHIENRNDLCSGSFFTGKNSILISSNDWYFKAVNLRKGTVKRTAADSKCMPFVLNRTTGYAATHKIHFPNGEIDCIEDISNVVSISSEVLVLGRNGSVFRIREAPDDRKSSSHIYETCSIYHLDTMQEERYIFE